MEKKKLFLICLFTGFLGCHYYAIGKHARGFVYTITVGLLGIGWIVDIFRILLSDDFIAVVEKEEREAKVKLEKTKALKQEENQKLNDYKREGISYCPKCKSTSLTADKKGFGVGKAAAGAVLAGPYGLLAGGIGSKKITITCLNCGYQFKPGKK